ncbi:branched-chain amino acid ABC transporter permease [Chloroflexales bacterium ZM16-3]|nr:branched-chain amino acid ABC transporter permease [Chloroflexales bacterium ZM16-3]
MAKSTPQTGGTGAWDQLVGLIGRGPGGYVFLSIYTLVTSLLLLLNPRTNLFTDIVFILFLLLILAIYRTKVHVGFKIALGVITLGFVMPYFGTLNPYYIDVATQAGIFATLAMGLNVVVGFAGLLDLGYVAFYAVGAYLWSIFSTPQVGLMISGATPIPSGWFYGFILLGLTVGGVFGVLLGLPVLRLRGDYLAIVTLGFGEVIRVLAVNLDKPLNITNGAQGIKDIERPPLFFADPLRAIFSSFGRQLDNNQLYQIFFYFMVLVVVLITILIVSRLKNSRIGRAWTAIREDETAAIAQGIPLVRMKLMAFAVGASFAGAMGVIFASKQLFINPPTFDLLRSIGILTMVILGGLGNIPGVILGAVLVTLLDLQILPRIAEILRSAQKAGWPIPSAFDPTQYQRLLFGLLMILMMIFRPEGILPEDRRRQELHEEDEEIVEDAAEAEAA